MMKIAAERNIILGTDWWTDCDDVAAVRIACRLAKKGVWNIAGFVLNACTEHSAASLDGFIRSEGLCAPIGIDLAADDFGGRPPYQKSLAKTLGSQLKNTDCEAGVRLYRRLLSGAADKSFELIEIGYLQVLAGLIESGGDEISPLSGTELIRQKVKTLWIMGGYWSSGRENNFSRNRRAVEGAHAVVGGYPGNIYFLGYEAGESVITRPRRDKADPLYRAFYDHGSANGRCSWDPMMILAAAAGADGLHDAGYEVITGNASVDFATGENSFTPSEHGMHAFLKKTMPDEWYETRINEIIA